MIAYQMNGADIALLNCYPVKLIVPGYYGTYWVKYLLGCACGGRVRNNSCRFNSELHSYSVRLTKHVKKKPQCLHIAAFFWWAPRESNTAPTDYAYQLRFSPPLSGLWSGLSLVITTCPYSLYTFSLTESFARDCHGFDTRGFPEFEQFY